MVHNGPLLHVGGETMNIEEALENLDQLEDESIYGTIPANMQKIRKSLLILKT